MSPRSTDRAVRRFNYSLQVWTINGIIQRCGHPDRMRTVSRSCCNAYELAGRHLSRIEIPSDPCADGCRSGCEHDLTPEARRDAAEARIDAEARKLLGLE